MPSQQEKFHQEWSKLLGMHYRNAQVHLVRKVAFQYFLQKQNGKCFRCGELLHEDSWHLDHIKAWAVQKNPQDSYWDLTNLAASHAGCNVRERNDRIRKKKRSLLKLVFRVIKS